MWNRKRAVKANTGNEDCSYGKPNMLRRNNDERYVDEKGDDRNRILQEEEEEDSEIRESYLRLAYMYENCSENTQNICQLIDEQREMLNSLCMEKRKWFC